MKKKIFAILFILCVFQKNIYALDISAESACLIISGTNEVIYEKNSGERMSMASTTKIMTAILALEKSSPDDIVTVSANAESQEGSSIYLARGDKIKMEDLLYGLMLNSGNDAAVAVAEYVSGNTEAFASEMTELAQKIGVKNTSFKNPSGLDEEGHYTTAYDLAMITSYAMKNTKFRKIVSTIEKSSEINNGDLIYFRNHNKLLKMYEGTIGVKTGYTKKSGRCLVSAAERDGIELIAVTINAPDDWNDHMNMLDYGFAGCKNMNIIKSGEVFKTIYTSDTQEIGCTLKDDISIPVFNNSIPESQIVTHFPKSLEAPLRRGDKIGEAEIVIEGSMYKKTDILCDRDVYGSSLNAFKNMFLKVIKRWQKIYLQ